MTEIVAEHGTNTDGFKGRGTLAELKAELDRQAASKVDFVASVGDLAVEADSANKQLLLVPRSEDHVQIREWVGRDGVAVQPQALQQMAGWMKPSPPIRFLRELVKENTATAMHLANGLIRAFPDGTRRLFRCLDGRLRAFLSDRYKFVDHHDVFVATLQAVTQMGGAPIEGTLSDTKMRLRFVNQSIADRIDQERQSGRSWYSGALGDQSMVSRVAATSRGALGDDLPEGPGTVYPALDFSNSETGHGGYNGTSGILTGICFNLAWVLQVMQRRHLGGKLDAGYMSQETRELEGQLIIARAKDIIAETFDRETFAKLVASIKGSQDDEIAAPTAAVAAVAGIVAIPEEEQAKLLETWLGDYDRTRYGLGQAVARLSQLHDDADKAEELEQLAGSIWTDKATAAAVMTAEPVAS